MTAIRAQLFGHPRGLRTPSLLVALSAAAALVIAAGVWMTFFYAPEERIMGFVQKIFYFHVPSAWLMLFSVPIMAVGAVMYLVKKEDRWDRLADTAVELSIVFGMLTLISGPLWGRKAWGVFWVWDVRLTSSLVLVLTLVATKIVRSYAGTSAKQIAAGLSILAVANALFVWISVDIWRGTHPPKLVQKLEGEMWATFWVCVLGFHLGYAALMWARLRVGKLRTALDHLHMQAAEADIDA